MTHATLPFWAIALPFDPVFIQRHARGGDVEMLLTIIERTSPQLGWGTWRFEADGDRLRLEVHNSPFAHSFGPSEQPVCHAVKGMLRGLADLWLGRPAQSSELQCSAQHHATCTFEARAA